MTSDTTSTNIDIRPAPISPAHWRVDADTPLNVMRCGIGACWHAIEHPSEPKYAGSAWGGNPPAADDRAWQRLYELADWTGMSFLRVEVSQRMYEPERRVFTWDSPEMRVLFRILNWCQSRGAVVFLQQQYNNVEWNAFPEFRGDEIAVLRSGPYSLEDYTHGLVSLVEFLVKERGYTCIRYLGLSNEPHEWCCWRSPTQDLMPMLPAAEAVSRELAARSLPVTLAGPDYVETPCSDAIDALAPHFGAFEIHSYGGSFDWRTEHASDWFYPMRQGVEKFAAWVDYAHRRDKPFFLGEQGTFDYGMGGSKPEPSSYEASLKDVEYAIRLMNVGVDGFCRWSFVNRGNLDGQWQIVDAWDAENDRPRNTITPHPNSFFLWGLLSRFIPAGATVLSGDLSGGIASSCPRVFATAAKNPDGQLTLVVVNDAEETVHLYVQVGGADAERLVFYRYRVGVTDRDRAAVRVDPQSACGSAFEDTLPPMSLTIYSTHHRRHEESSPHVRVNVLESAPCHK